jgi:hypothetical protein
MLVESPRNSLQNGAFWIVSIQFLEIQVLNNTKFLIHPIQLLTTYILLFTRCILEQAINATKNSRSILTTPLWQFGRYFGEAVL